MSNPRGKSPATAPFDDLLKESRERFETLAGSPKPGSGSSRGRHDPSPPASGDLGRPPDAATVRQFLNSKYGDRWHHEILERKREKDQVIVLCNLIIEDEGVSKSQFGKAVIGRDSGNSGNSGNSGGSGDLDQMAGTVKGIPFTFTPSGADTGDGEAAAFHRATESALAKCAESL